MGRSAPQAAWETKGFQELVSKEQKQTGLTYEQLHSLFEGMGFNRAFYVMALNDIVHGCSYSLAKDTYCGSWIRVH